MPGIEGGSGNHIRTPNELFGLAGKTVLLTGASSGSG